MVQGAKKKKLKYICNIHITNRCIFTFYFYIMNSDKIVVFSLEKCIHLESEVRALHIASCD